MQGAATAAGLGLSNLPVSAYPGTINFHSAEEVQKNVATALIAQVVEGLTVQPAEAELPSEAEPESRDVIFKGTLAEVNSFFYAIAIDSCLR